MSNKVTETKVGLLVLTAVAGLGWLSFQSGTLPIPGVVEQSTRSLESTFTDVGGIIIGSKVKMAGVNVGEVSDIELTLDGNAIIRMTVDSKYKLPANVKAQISSSGIIGEKFVALMTDFGAQGILSDEIVRIPSAGSVSVADMAQNFAKVSEDLEQITASLRTALGGPDNAQKLTRIVDSMDNIGTRLDDILNREIEQDKVKNIVDGLASFSNTLKSEGDGIISDVKVSMRSLKNILASNEQQASNMIANLGVASENLAKITTRLENGQGTLGKLMTEDSSLIDDLQIAAADLRSIAGKVNDGEGTIGRLINDPSTVDKIENALDSISGFGERMEAFRTEVSFEGYSLAAEDVAKGRFQVKLSPRPTRFYTLGVLGDGFNYQAEDSRSTASYKGDDFGDALKFTVQFGHVFQSALLDQDLGLRIGIKDSTFGVGADMSVPMPFWDELVEVSTDLYDMSGESSGNSNQTPHLDVTARVRLFDDSFYAMGGYDNVLNQEYGSPFVGVGFKFQDDDLKYMMGQAL